MGGKRFFISNSAHPCTEIALDSNRIRAFYLANGWEETLEPGGADDLIVSTCAYNQQYEDAAFADLEARRHALKPGGRLISTGCFSRISPVRHARAGVHASVGPLELERFNDLIGATVGVEGITSNSVRMQEYEANPFFLSLVRLKEKLQSASRRFGIDLVPNWMATIPTPDWFFIRGSVGCLGRCTYCAVRRAKGTLISTPLPLILSQVEAAVREGKREISLAGDDMGGWGTDIGSNLGELLAAMTAVSGDFRINLRFVEPVFLMKCLEDLIPVFETGKISAFCLPIQSGSDRVLDRMGRDYSIAELEKTLQAFSRVPNRPRLATILMVGFPGETHEDFLMSCRLIDRLPIDLYQILEYEGRPNTPSVAMADQVPVETKKWRHDRMLRKFKLQKVVGLPAAIADRLAGLSDSRIGPKHSPAGSRGEGDLRDEPPSEIAAGRRSHEDA